MNDPYSNLDAWLAAARDNLAREAPPRWIEPALAARQAERALLLRLKAVQVTPQASRAPRPARRLARVWRWALPAAAVVAAAVVLAVALIVGLPAASRDPAAPSFLALRPLEAIAAEPQPIVITSDVPRAQLAAYGLPVDPARADLPVRAEFLVSRRGAVLAVRFSPE